MGTEFVGLLSVGMRKEGGRVDPFSLEVVYLQGLAYTPRRGERGEWGALG